MTEEKEKHEPIVYPVYPLTEKYRIQCDAYNYILQSKTPKDWNTVGYYSRIGSLVAKLYELEIRENINDLDYLAKLKDELIKTVSKFNVPMK